MNVLVISTRYPWPPFSGDRLRATIWLEALSAGANVTLVAPAPPPADTPPTVPFAFHPAERSVLHTLPALLRVAREGLPLHTLLAAPYRWREAIAAAESARGPFDATVVILSRVEPWVRTSLPRGVHILDAIDSLAVNMEERARHSSPLTRWLWRIDERRSAAAERKHAAAYSRVLLVSEAEAHAHARTEAVTNGVRVRPLHTGPRRFDFGFWGRLAYFANDDAARWLIDEIWPFIRAAYRSATLVIAGADAPAWLRRAATAQAGITLLSPVSDLAAVARDTSVAILPLRYGSGESTKMLEAAEAGCAVVATARGTRNLPALAHHAMIAEDASSIAHAAIALLRDDTQRTLRAAGLRSAVAEHYSREKTLARLLQVARESTTSVRGAKPGAR